MNLEHLVEVEYQDPEIDKLVITCGELREGSRHLLLISGSIEGIDQYTYTIIPKVLIKKISKLKIK